MPLAHYPPTSELPAKSIPTMPAMLIGQEGWRRREGPDHAHWLAIAITPNAFLALG